MEEEIKRRLDILNKMKVPRIDARMLRGGMQKRLHRQVMIRHGKNIETQKKKLHDRLSLIEQERQSEGFEGFTTQSMEPLDDFNEPVFRRIRSRRGFFDL